MKEYYVLKGTGKDNYFLFKKNEFDKIGEYKNKYPTYNLKGFYSKKKALEYANSETYERNFYVVRLGRKPGIYTSKIEMAEQVMDFPNALVMNATTEEKAKQLMELDLEEILKLKKVKKEKDKKKEKQDVVFSEKKISSKRKEIKKEIENKIKSSDYIAFIDCEANDHIAISIGLVIYSLKEEKIVDTYYSLVRPKNFIAMDKYVMEMTSITNDMILNAPKISLVMNQIEQFLNQYRINYIFSCGSSDKEFLQKYENEYSKIGMTTMKMHNIQNMISLYFTYGVEKKRNIGLKTLKEKFDLGNEKIKHNALDDALDLANVIHCWFQELKNI